MCHLQLKHLNLENAKRDEMDDGEPPAKVLIRQTQKYAKAIRTDAPSDAIQLAAAQAL